MKNNKYPNNIIVFRKMVFLPIDSRKLTMDIPVTIKPATVKPNTIPRVTSEPLLILDFTKPP